MSVQKQGIYEFHDFQLNIGKGILFRENQPVPMQWKTFELLCTLVKSNGNLMTRDELMDELWADTFVDENNLSQHIRLLRKVLGEGENGTIFIETVPRRGYRFLPEVRVVDVESNNGFKSHNGISDQIPPAADSPEAALESLMLVPAMPVSQISVNADDAKNAALINPETKLLENEKPAKSKTARLNRSTVLFSLTIFLLAGASVWLFWQFKKSDDSRSFDTLRSVRLISWKAVAGTDYTDYSVSHGGAMIAYSSTQNGENEGIYVKQITDGEEIRVTKDEWNNYSPIWSPDDQRLAFVSVRESQSGIYISPSLGGTAVALKIIGKGKISLRHWSKDGNTIFYEYQFNLFRIDVATRETAQITNFGAMTRAQRYFSFSPDESQIAYCDETDRQEDIWIMPVGGGAARRLTNDKHEEMRPRWHPDGKRILYNVIRDDLSQINVAYTDGRAPAQVTRGEGEYEIIDVSKDGAKIFYSNFEKRSDISGVKIETGEEFEVAAGIESEFWTDVSPDGKSIVFQTNAAPHLTPFLQASSIFVKSLTNGSPQFLQKGYSPRWLPDSRRVAFLRWQAAEQKYNLWLVNALSGEQKQLTTDGISSPSVSLMPINRNEIGVFSWSPDGKQFVYLESKNRNVRAASVESPETTNLTNNLNSYIRYYSPLWSPDGKRIVYVSIKRSSENMQSAIWSVWLAEDGKTREIFSTPASLRLLGWSASGGELLFEMTDGVMKSSPSDIRLLQVSITGGTRIITTFKNVYADTMTLSADKKTLAFTARQNDKDDIWTAPTDGGEVRKITANGNSRIFFGSPTFAPDGKTIFFDKQDQINTISMFENFK